MACYSVLKSLYTGGGQNKDFSTVSQMDLTRVFLAMAQATF